MQVEIQIDENFPEPKVIVKTNKMTERIQELVKNLSDDESSKMIAGFREDTVELLEQEDIIRIYSSSGKVYAVTKQHEYVIRLRLYELESRLDKNKFVRISNSEIINLKKVKSFDLSFTGTICVSLLNGTVTYVSRRYVTKIKQVLGI